MTRRASEVLGMPEESDVLAPGPGPAPREFTQWLDNFRAFFMDMERRGVVEDGELAFNAFVDYVKNYDPSQEESATRRGKTLG
jgi:hypothetical protein